MYEASSPIDGRGFPVATRPRPHVKIINRISVSADRFFRTQADSRRWILGLAQPATGPVVRLHEPILWLKGLTGELVSETIPAGVRFRRLRPGGLPRPGAPPVRGYFPAGKVAAVHASDTISALKRDRPPHSHDRVPARRRSASPPGGDPLPAARPRPFPAVGPEPRHLPKPPAASGEASPL
jgi:hypothetical protein